MAEIQEREAMTPEERAKRVTRQWSKDSRQVERRKVGLKALIARAIWKAEFDVVKKAKRYRATLERIARIDELAIGHSTANGSQIHRNDIINWAKEALSEMDSRE